MLEKSSLPTKTHNITLCNKLTKLGIPIIQTTAQTIKNLTNIRKRTSNETTSHADIKLHTLLRLQLKLH